VLIGHAGTRNAKASGKARIIDEPLGGRAIRPAFAAATIAAATFDPQLGKEIVMNRLTASIAAATIALTLAAPVYAQSEQQQPQDQAQREQEYMAALKKCEPLAGAEKQKCIDAAKKKLGQM
jgi:hypothetical protein